MKHSVRGAGPAVLLLHGLPTSGRLWDFIVPRLEKDLTCVVVDLPGAGESPPFPDGSLAPERFAQELEALRIEVGLDRWHLVGHDAGSAIAVHYAAHYSAHVERLVLCSPPLFPEHTIPWFFRILRTPLLGDALAPLVASKLMPLGIKAAVRRDDPALPAIIAAFCRPFNGPGGSRRLLHLLRWGEPAQVLGPTAALIPTLCVPTLVLSGVHDGAVPTRFAVRAAKLIPNAKLDLLDCGHFLPIECPDVVADHLLFFLRSELLPSRGGDFEL